MSYSNSPLVSYTNLTDKHSGLRTHKIDRITPHCVVGQWSCNKIADFFKSTSKVASCNYGIGYDGKVSLSVEEKNRSWCSSSNANDQRAITIECASDTVHPYKMNEAVYGSLVNLCVDICKRYNKTKLLWIPDKDKALVYNPNDDEMLLTVHRWFANKSCPGDWLYSRLPDLANTVTKKLGSQSEQPSIPYLYKVQVGAYRNKANARERAKKLKRAGFDAIIIEGKSLYRVQAGAFKERVNADNLLAKLKAEGFDSFIIGSTSKSVDALANEVIKGLWGNGPDRKKRLTTAGYDYNAVQKRVNEILR